VKPVPLLFLLLASCTLIDQRTFDPAAGTPPVPPPAKVAATPTPASSALVTIRYGQDTDYDPAIREAVTAALARKRDAAFTVVTAIPTGGLSAPPGAPAAGAPDAQAAAVAEMTPEAARIARLIETRGVPADRVQLEARPEPGLAARELRIYVH